MNAEIFLIKLLLVLPHIHKIFRKFDLLRFKHYVLNFKILGALSSYHVHRFSEN